MASVDMSHGSYHCMSGAFNVDFKHCVPYDRECILPRVSLVFRRADKYYVHPTENQTRSYRSKTWKPLNGKNGLVELRRQ